MRRRTCRSQCWSTTSNERRRSTTRSEGNSVPSSPQGASFTSPGRAPTAALRHQRLGVRRGRILVPQRAPQAGVRSRRGPGPARTTAVLAGAQLREVGAEGPVMAKMNSEATIARPVEDVFRFFLDLEDSAPKTDPSVESVVKTPDGPTGPGTTFPCVNTRLASNARRRHGSPRCNPTGGSSSRPRSGRCGPRAASAFTRRTRERVSRSRATPIRSVR